MHKYCSNITVREQDMKTYKELVTEARKAATKLPRSVAFMLKATVESKKVKVWIEDDEWSTGMFFIGQAKRNPKNWWVIFDSFDLGLSDPISKEYKTEEQARADFASLKPELKWDEIWSTWKRKK